MSEHRAPTEVWTIKLPENQGNKSTKNCLKIELFPAHFWAMNWEPGSKSFSPRPPLPSVARKEFWETHYRIRVSGLWEGQRAKYVFFTKEQIVKKYFL